MAERSICVAERMSARQVGFLIQEDSERKANQITGKDLPEVDATMMIKYAMERCRRLKKIEWCMP